MNGQNIAVRDNSHIQLAFRYQEVAAATDNFSDSHVIGKGSHGRVYRGILKDGKLVAIKKQSLGLQKLQDNSKLENEVGILSSLPHNPYMINLLGTCYDSAENKLLVMEYMPNGTLHEMLHAASTPPPPWTRRVEIVLQIAKAVKSLHEANPAIIHRDIKSTNILFDSNWNAKLSDFGLSIRMSDDSISQKAGSVNNRPAGTMGYLDPCYTKPSKLSTKNDIFSFGMLLLEIISSRKVIDVSKTPASLVDWAMPLMEAGRAMEICDNKIPVPRFMAGTIKHMLAISARCVSSKVDHRPSIGEVVMEIENSIIEPVRLPIWMNLLRSFVLLKKHTKIGKKHRKNISSCPTTITCSAHKANGHVDISGKKLLVREILADITLK